MNNVQAYACPVCGSDLFDRVEGKPFMVCRGCGLGQMMPASLGQRVVDLRNDGYDSFAPYDPGEADHKRRLSERIEVGYNAVQGRGDVMGNPGSMFEVGFGNAYIMEAMQKRGWRAFGCDTSGQAAESASKRGMTVFRGAFDDPHEVNNQVAVWRDGNRAAAAGGYDLVVAWDSFEHMRDLRSAFYVTSRILKQGGVLAMHSPYRPSYQETPDHPHWQDPSHLWHMTIKSAAMLATSNGLLVIKEEVAQCWGEPGYAHPQNFCLWARKL